MKVFLFRPMHVAIVVLVLALAGCLVGQSPPTNFYLLSPMSPSPAGNQPASGAAPIHIGLETVVIAEYLNRNEIVLNLDNTVYQLAEFNQWAEPLDDNLTRVLETNLTRLLHADSIEIFMASQSSILLDYRLEIDVLISPLAEEGQRRPRLRFVVDERICQASGTFWILPALQR